MPEITSYFSKLSFWSKLTEDEKKYLHDSTSIKEYKTGSYVFDSNNECLGMIYLLSGSVRVYIMSEEGREVTLYKLEAGEYCVLSASCVIRQISFDSYMVVENDTRLIVVNAGALEKLSNQNIYLRCFIYELATERFSMVMQSMHRLLFVKLDGRLAAFLVGEYDRTGIKEIKMTHEQIAQHISSAREVVARTLKRFSTDKLVEVRRGSITLLDVDRLRQML